MRNHFGNNLGIILWDNEPYSTQWETIPNLHMLLCGDCRKPYTPQCGFIAPGFPHWEIRTDSYHNWWENQWILKQVGWILWNMVSGKHTKNYGTSPFFMGKILFLWPFSIAMLVYQGVADISPKLVLDHKMWCSSSRQMATGPVMHLDGEFSSYSTQLLILCH